MGPEAGAAGGVVGGGGVSFLVVSLSYRSVPMADLERVAFREGALGDALSCILLTRDVLEAALLSTCNRTEVLAWTREPGPASVDVRRIIEDLRGLPRGWTDSRGLILEGEEAIRHLFLVVAGLDSMAPGESQIQGQVREAYRSACELGSVGPNMHALFGRALDAGRRVRAGSGLAKARLSLSEAGVEAIGAALGDLCGRETLVVGAGKMAELALQALRARGAGVAVVARRPEAGAALAKRVGCPFIPVAALEQALGRADAAVFATAAPHVILTGDSALRAARARDRDPLVIVDLGVPHNVDPEVGEVEGISLYDLDRLHLERATGADGWGRELSSARELALAEADRCAAWFRSRGANDFVTRVQQLATDLAASEAERAARAMGVSEEAIRDAVAQAVRGALRKILHTPTVRAKEAAARGDEAALETARWLFGLDDDAADSGAAGG
ncbi:MAG: glutamyl-tRNA reductase [Acidobacteria bacterium]|nr:glutamyl-tRNA reductase [Acidobacteriota bacterium]